MSTLNKNGHNGLQAVRKVHTRHKNWQSLRMITNSSCFLPWRRELLFKLTANGAFFLGKSESFEHKSAGDRHASEEKKRGAWLLPGTPFVSQTRVMN
jgi:hypothetical protein